MAAKIHPLSDVASTTIGDGSTVWQFSVILKDAVIGKDCNVNAHCFIENDVVIGDRVTLKCGVYVWDGIRLEDDVFIGPNVTFCNDKFPRSKVRPDKFMETRIKKGASVGAGAIILPGVVVGAGAMIGAGAVVTRDVPDGVTVIGNPAKVINSKASS